MHAPIRREEIPLPADAPPLWKRWLMAPRPWCLPISTIPIWMGAAIAWVYGGRFHWGIFLLTWLGAVLSHFASNMISDVYDFRSSLDREPTPGCGAVVRGWLTSRQVFIGGVSAMLLAGLAGAAIAAQSTQNIWIVAAIGAVLLMGYSAFKRVAIGDVAVFLVFGPLMGLGAWMAQTGYFSWQPMAWLAPFGLVVIGVLHANNWRDMARDRSAGIRTVALLLGDRGSLAWYGVCIFGPYVVMVALMTLPRLWPALGTPMPWTCICTLLALPLTLKLWKRARLRHVSEKPDDFLALDAATAQSMVPFGVLSTLAILLARWFLQ